MIILPFLHLSLFCFISFWEIFHDWCCCEHWPCGMKSCSDHFEQCFCWKSCCCMVVAYDMSCVGQFIYIVHHCVLPAHVISVVCEKHDIVFRLLCRIHWDSQQFCFGVLLPLEYWTLCAWECCFISKYFYLVWCENCEVVCLCKLTDTEERIVS